MGNSRSVSLVTCLVAAPLLVIELSPSLCGIAPTPSAPQVQGGAVAGHPYTSGVQIRARFTDDRGFQIDGDLDKNFWRRPYWVQFGHDMSGSLQYPGEQTRVAALWSARYVYFAFVCHYVSLNTYEGEDVSKERWELWNRDVAEVFVNPQPERVNHYFEFEVAPNNQWIDLEIDKDKNPFNDAAWNSGFSHATRIDAARHVWTCEMRIPVASMKTAAVRPGEDWRVNFYRATGVGDDSKRHFMSWSTIPDGNTFHVPTRFGLLHFLK
jgi:hypothetical protein